MDTLPDCLTALTDFAMTTYTQFYAYVNQACIRLMQELMIEHVSNAGAGLVKASALAEHRIATMLEHQQAFLTTWESREREFMELHDSFQAQVHRNSQLFQEYTELALQEQQTQQEQWRKEQDRFQQEQAMALKRQQAEIEALSNAVASANTSIRPWSVGLSTIREHTVRAYFLVMTLAYGLGALVTISVMTYIGRFRWIRKYLKTILAVQVLLEVTFILYKKDDNWDAEKDFFVCLRFLSLVSGGCLWTVGIFVSFCWWRSAPVAAENGSDDNQVHGSTENHQKMLELIESLDERIHQISSQQQQQHGHPQLVSPEMFPLRGLSTPEQRPPVPPPIYMNSQYRYHHSTMVPVQLPRIALDVPIAPPPSPSDDTESPLQLLHQEEGQGQEHGALSGVPTHSHPLAEPTTVFSSPSPSGQINVSTYVPVLGKSDEESTNHHQKRGRSNDSSSNDHGEREEPPLKKSKSN